MKQQTLAGFERYGKTTRRAQFLAQMEQIVPWAELQAVVEPFYPKVSEAGGRPPIPLERMLRIYFLQLWFNLSDPAVEEALYDSAAMRSFAGIDLGQEAAPDETTVCKFRHLLERNKLGKSMPISIICSANHAAVRRFLWSGCCASTFCNCGSTCPTRQWKKHCTTRSRCAASPESTWARRRRRMRRRCASSAICWSGTSSASRC